MKPARDALGEDYSHEKYVMFVDNAFFKVDNSHLTSDKNTIMIPNGDFKAWRKAAEICGYTPEDTIDAEKIK